MEGESSARNGGGGFADRRYSAAAAGPPGRSFAAAGGDPQGLRPAGSTAIGRAWQRPRQSSDICARGHIVTRIGASERMARAGRGARASRAYGFAAAP
jgi:hypothetical protein